MHRFHFNPHLIQDGLITLDKNQAHHAKKVLRLKPGEVVELLDGQGGLFRGLVSSLENQSVSIKILNSINQSTSPVELSLAASVIKPERMEWMLEKSCELGVKEFIPILTQRVVIHLSAERWKSKVQRWRRIAVESCKQCGQSLTPAIHEPADYSNLIKDFKKFDLVLIPTLNQKSRFLKEALESKKNAGKVLILIGPEGDFTGEESKEAIKAGAIPVSLGDLVMRAETAAIYTLSSVGFFFAK